MSLANMVGVWTGREAHLWKLIRLDFTVLGAFGVSPAHAAARWLHDLAAYLELGTGITKALVDLTERNEWRVADVGGESGIRYFFFHHLLFVLI